MVTRLNSFIDNRGDLTPIEFKDMPFIPQRIFIVKNIPENTKRGGHAHFKTKQLLVCLKGLIKVTLFDGNTRITYPLREGETILINEMIWDYQEFSSNQDILLVLCSTPYDKNDYILDLEEFERIANGKS